jgi:general stress protein YciG
MTTNNQKPDQSPTRQGGSGTIAEDSRRSSEAGQKRGPQTGGTVGHDREKASEAGQKGGHPSGGNFAQDRDRASDAGTKGGQHNQTGR